MALAAGREAVARAEALGEAEVLQLPDPPLELGLVDVLAPDAKLVMPGSKGFGRGLYYRHDEMEYGVPFDALPEAFERVRRLAEGLERRPLLPVEVRASAADDIPLSTAEGRTSGWIAVHQDPRLPSGDYFRGVEAIMDDYAGRPHWGKLHFQTHDVLQERYPRWDEFAAVRARLDPAGVFRNDYLDRILGPIS